MALKCTILASLVKPVEFLQFDLVFQCVTYEYKQKVMRISSKDDICSFVRM